LNLPKRGEFVLERGNSKYKGILMSLLWGKESAIAIDTIEPHGAFALCGFVLYREYTLFYVS
jgi:hypothetical protein